MFDYEKPEIDEDLLKRIRFERRILGVGSDGKFAEEDTPEGMRDWFLRDARLPGFAVRVTRGGISFYAQRKLSGQPCRFHCGAWPQTRLKLARERADDALKKMTAGIDPNRKKKTATDEIAEHREKSRKTFGKMFAQDAISRASSKDKPGFTEAGGVADAPTTARDRRDVQKWLEGLPIWKMPTVEVGPDDLSVMMSEITKVRGSPSALKCWRYARAAWGRQENKPGEDPFDYWLSKNTLPKIAPRQTSISTDEEKGKNWLRSVAALRTMEGSRAFSRRVQADFTILSLCWGSRRSEASCLLAEDVDFERACVFFRDTKNSRTHAFPLTPGCAQILKARLEDNAAPRGRDVKKAAKGETYYIPNHIFPSPKRGRHLVEARTALGAGKDGSGLKIVLHDLRRGFAGAVAMDAFSHGAGLSVVKLAMNHADATNDVTWGYIQTKLTILRPMYLAQERRVFESAGLEALLPNESKLDGTATRQTARIRIRKENSLVIASIEGPNGLMEAQGETVTEAKELLLAFISTVITSPGTIPSLANPDQQAQVP